jgi:hypothetical protein
MNKIEQELLVEINNAMDFTIESEPEINDKDAAKYCYSLLEKHCKAFAEFYFINEFNSNKEDCLTTEELFNLYIEQL